MANKIKFRWFDILGFIVIIIAIILMLCCSGCAFYNTPIGTVVTCFKDIDIKDAIVIADPNSDFTIIVIGDYAGKSDGEEAGKFTGTLLKTFMGL